MPKNLRKRRDKLYKKEKGKCYWCGKQTKNPPIGDRKFKTESDTATADHLNTRFDKERYEPNHNNEQRVVLSCWECNSIRGLLHEKMFNEKFIFKLKSNNIVEK